MSGARYAGKRDTVALVGAGLGSFGHDVFVDQCVGELHGSRGESSDASGKPGLRGDGNFGAPLLDGRVDFVGCVVGCGGDNRRVGHEVEPAAFELDIADELGVGFAAGAHQPRTNGGDADAFVAKLGVQSLRKADQRELRG